MKKFKTGLVALALVLGVSGAFVSKIHAAPKEVDPTYDWNVGQPDQLINATVSTATSNYGCNSGTITCASGTLDPNSPVQADDVTLFKH